MKHAIFLILIVCCLFCCERSEISPDAVDLKVDFTWEGYRACDRGNPELTINGVPENTKFLEISMFDHAYYVDHGKVTVPYSGSGKFKRGTLMELLGPCPPGGPGRYEITVKALDADEVIIGIGSKERYFPEEK